MVPPPVITIGHLAFCNRETTSLINSGSGNGRRTCQTRFSKNSAGHSKASAWTSSGRLIVAAPVSAGSVIMRNASGKLASNCSGREIRSKNRETGRKASRALTERERSDPLHLQPHDSSTFSHHHTHLLPILLSSFHILSTSPPFRPPLRVVVGAKKVDFFLLFKKKKIRSKTTLYTSPTFC